VTRVIIIAALSESSRRLKASLMSKISFSSDRHAMLTMLVNLDVFDDFVLLVVDWGYDFVASKRSNMVSAEVVEVVALLVESEGLDVIIQTNFVGGGR